MALLCLNEETPVVLALCLFGAVFFIVGGSLWGKGDNIGDSSMETTGIALFALGIVFLGLGGLGMACNRWLCTPKRKSLIAMTIYSKSDKSPKAYHNSDEFDGDDLEEWGSKATYRSLRASRQSVRGSRASLRRSQVHPTISPSGVPFGIEAQINSPDSVIRVHEQGGQKPMQNHVTASTGSVQTHSYSEPSSNNPVPVPVENNIKDTRSNETINSKMVYRTREQGDAVDGSAFTVELRGRPSNDRDMKKNSNSTASHKSNGSVGVSESGSAIVSNPVLV